ncbi:MAG: cation:proton antiporter subunit C, partial [Verrucomicrobiales bacterium]
METVIANFNYWIYVILMMIGLFAMIAKKNLIKKLVGMTIFQTAIILFYVSIGVKHGASIPILSHDEVHGEHHAEPSHGDDPHHEGDTHVNELPHIDASKFANPIPHVLMLTAIVVGVSTLGVALALSQRVHKLYGSLE